MSRESRCWAALTLLLALPASSIHATDLAKIERTIAKEPVYKNKPKYCLLVFGSEAKFRVWLVLDGHTLYVDRNSNGNLTEADEKIVLEEGRDFPGTRQCRLRSFPVVDRHIAEISLRFVAHPDGRCFVLVRGGTVAHHVWGLPRDLRFADQARDAPIIHLFGPATIILKESPALTPGKSVTLEALVGTQGLAEGTFAWFEHGLPEKETIAGEAEFPARAPGQPSIKRKFSLKGGCCAPFGGSLDVPAEAGAGKAKISLSLPTWKEGKVTPATFLLTLVAPPFCEPLPPGRGK
jgi:hypothetical protein